MRQVSVGILSIGDMGMGVAKLLKAHGYRVLTVGEGRSEETLARIRAAAIESLASDQELVIQSDYILSIVPPRDALATARRVAEAYRLPDTVTRREELEDVDGLQTRGRLVYLDLNATPARSASEVEALFTTSHSDDDDTKDTTSEPLCSFLDGGIIGGPPSQDPQNGLWKKPSVVVSGAVALLPATFTPLCETLNMKLVSPRVGAASTLKLSFAALTKGLTALSLLSFATAQQEELLPELLEHLREYSPHTAALATRGVSSMAPKAYRWVEEMRGIGEALDAEGHWGGLGGSVYNSFAEVYRTIAEETILGQERVGSRQRGTSADDVAQILADKLRQSGRDQ
ncbi:hypothetical protein ASPZODRAFT_131826 [Penicilliopsis zonata CBS 506.65]|uniref:Phosphogluconate dehydrogenase NAD-binding putative C-terminal domain-containing protein n=1 Tax=Penicilliopsis zonata CBS 506.65 TaxID=1073090 RepID=A0A1L9SIE5_9EURO|nr:hypothetical protein ASPZODRAFT_131826 [Penicilliopsis zonata CBS 506.65]OJJ46917.1 hypothetical protein ASPZODRAFT_131826 [Penicilliopsis zonata CBS 506.65]